jgi:hypothetical protein
MICMNPTDGFAVTSPYTGEAEKFEILLGSLFEGAVTVCRDWGCSVDYFVLHLQLQ